jgi:restriction endonuclease Mrr
MTVKARLHEKKIFPILRAMIPVFKPIMLPLLEKLSTGQEHHLRDNINKISDQFNLTPEERTELLPIGSQPLSTIGLTG